MQISNDDRKQIVLYYGMENKVKEICVDDEEAEMFYQRLCVALSAEHGFSVESLLDHLSMHACLISPRAF